MIESAAELSFAIERALRSRLRTHPLLEDAIQEAHIEAWRRLEDGEDYGRVLWAAIWRGQDVTKGKMATGAPERTPGSGSRVVSQTSWEAHVESSGDSTPTPLPSPERAVFLEQALDLLEPVERFIVEAMMAGYVHADIAEALDRSVGAIRKRMPAIRSKLEPILEDLRAS